MSSSLTNTQIGRPYEPWELDKIISLEEAAKTSSLSVDTWERTYPDKIIKLSARRRGVRLRDALFLPPK
jgi:hypothetical protein